MNNSKWNFHLTEICLILQWMILKFNVFSIRIMWNWAFLKNSCAFREQTHSSTVEINTDNLNENKHGLFVQRLLSQGSQPLESKMKSLTSSSNWCQAGMQATKKRRPDISEISTSWWHTHNWLPPATKPPFRKGRSLEQTVLTLTCTSDHILKRQLPPKALPSWPLNRTEILHCLNIISSKCRELTLTGLRPYLNYVLIDWLHVWFINFLPPILSYLCSGRFFVLCFVWCVRYQI